MINYWKDKTAGEDFTHILNQENLYLNRILQYTSKNNQLLNNFQQLKPSSFHLPLSITPFHIYLKNDFKESLFEWKQQKLPKIYFEALLNFISQNNSFNNNSFNYFPSTCSSIAIPKQFSKSINNNNKTFFEDLKNYYCNLFIQSSKISINNNEEMFFPSILLFHVNNSSLDSLINTIYSNYSLHNWANWNIIKKKESDEEINSTNHEIQIVTASTIEACREWKLNMPGEWIEPTD